MCLHMSSTTHLLRLWRRTKRASSGGRAVQGGTKLDRRQAFQRIVRNRKPTGGSGTRSKVSARHCHHGCKARATIG